VEEPRINTIRNSHINMQRRVIVLGASSGIGKAIAERFDKEGWQILLVASDLPKLRSVLGNLKGKHHMVLAIDVTVEDQIENLSQFVKMKFPRFHVLINSVGISKNDSLFEPNFKEWDRSFQTMFYGALKVCRVLVPNLSDGGRIIHLTSIHYKRVAKGSSAYGIAKAALTQLSRSLAIELAPRNILSNAIAPGFIDTPMSVKQDGENELHSQWFKDNYLKYDHLPLKRAGKPEEVAGVAWFLAGPDASYITGSVITVDGGLTITF
jgi:NAD(P)-dependent dehydrogenase (short-subunit alcohol dehydrogenase family)